MQSPDVLALPAIRYLCVFLSDIHHPSISHRFKSLRTSLPGELRLAPYAPGWHAIVLSLSLSLSLSLPLLLLLSSVQACEGGGCRCSE